MSSSTNWAEMVPTVKNSTCSGTSNCAIGSQCSSTSMCTTGSCCAYVMNSDADLASLNTTYPSTTDQSGMYIYVNSSAAVTAYMNVAYLPSRYCLSNVNGTSNSSFYDSTTTVGLALASNATSSLLSYVCNSLISIGKA